LQKNSARAKGNLDLCIETPKRELFGQQIHKTIHEKAASLISSVHKLHPFLDGNKRTGFEACDVFLRMNGYILNIRKDDAVDASLKIAACSMDLVQTSLLLKAKIKRSID